MGKWQVKGIIMLIIITVCSLALQAKSHGISNEHLWVNGNMIVLNNSTGFFYTENNTTYIPINTIVKALNYKFTWDSKKNQGIINNDKKNMRINLNNKNTKIVNGKVYISVRTMTTQFKLPLKVLDNIIYIGKFPTHKEIDDTIVPIRQSIFNVFNNKYKNIEAFTKFDIDGDGWLELILLENNKDESGRKLNVYKYDLVSKQVKNILSIDDLSTSNIFSNKNIYISSIPDTQKYAICITDLSTEDSYETITGYAQLYIFDRSSIVDIKNEFKLLVNDEQTINSDFEKVSTYNRYLKDGKIITEDEFNKIPANYSNIMYEAALYLDSIPEDTNQGKMWQTSFPKEIYIGETHTAQ